MAMTESFKNSLIEFKTLIAPITNNWFIIGGACLGFVRNGKFIDHDIDLDIGIIEDEDKIQQILSDLPVIKKSYYKGQLMEVVLQLDCQVDIFLLQPYRDFLVEAVFAESINRVRLFAYPQSIFSAGTGIASINGIEVNVLVESKAYCTTLYGTEYQVEKPGWNCWLDPYNIIHEDEITPTLHVSSISEFGVGNFKDIIPIILKLLADIVSRKVMANFELSTYKSCLGAVVFFYYYFRHTNDSIYYNLSNFLLSRFNSIVIPGDQGFAEGIVGYAIIIKHLVKNGFLEVENTFFGRIDQCVLRLLEEQTGNHGQMELPAICTYMISRITEDAADIGIQNKFKDHLKVAADSLQKTTHQILFMMSDCNELPGSFAHLSLLRKIVVLNKIWAIKEQIFDENASRILQDGKEKTTLLFNKIMTAGNLPDLTLLLAFATMEGEAGSELIDGLLETPTFIQEGEAALRMYDLQSYIRIALLRKKEHHYNPLWNYLNTILFEKGTLKLDPYTSLGGIEHISLHGGLPVIGLQLLSLLDLNHQATCWDEILLLS